MFYTQGCGYWFTHPTIKSMGFRMFPIIHGTSGLRLGLITNSCLGLLTNSTMEQSNQHATVCCYQTTRSELTTPMFTHPILLLVVHNLITHCAMSLLNYDTRCHHHTPQTSTIYSCLTLGQCVLVNVVFMTHNACHHGQCPCGMCTLWT